MSDRWVLEASACLAVGGQDIMTADKVTLRLNAVVTYKIVDARKAVSQTEDVRQTLYRETQLVLRSVIGARELDAFLTEKDAVAKEIEENVRRRAGRQPGSDAAARTGSPRKDRCKRQAQHRAGG